MTFSDDLTPNRRVSRQFGVAETDNPGDTLNIDITDARALAQRRLALKLAANAGLSVALAEVLVVVALGNGRL